MEMICTTSKSLKSIHLMVTFPESYIDSIIKCNPEVVFIHVDNCRFPYRIIRKFQDSEVNVGIAINPNVAVSDIYYVLPLVKNVLIMMCEPDGRNQEYLEIMENKIIEIANFKNIEIWVDGGISFDKLARLEELNVSSVVMGRSIFQIDNNLR